MSPKWNPQKLATNRKKHRACFEDLLKISNREITEREYADRAQRAIDNRWMEYEGESYESKDRCYREPRVIHVDDELVVAITDMTRSAMITSFHEDFDRPHGTVPGPRATVGDRKLRYRRQLRWDDQGRMIRNLKVIKDV